MKDTTPSTPSTTVFPALISGLIFAAGLGIGGMTNPEKVQGFLDVSGQWDPSLAFVMFGAITIYSIGYRFVSKLAKPLCDGGFRLPEKRTIDTKVALGSAMFGVGWGLAGYCPGPGLVAIGSFSLSAAIFVAAMLVGMMLFNQTHKST